MINIPELTQPTIWFVTLVWLFIILTLSSITDMRTRKIPNSLTLSTLISIPLMLQLSYGNKGLIFSGSGLIAGLAVFAIPYLIGKMGAGDVKLMACVGTVFGPFHTLIAALFTTIAGGIIALILLLKQRIGTNSQKVLTHSVNTPVQQPSNTESTQETIPYAVAITGGVILYLIYLFATNQQSLLISVL